MMDIATLVTQYGLAGVVIYIFYRLISNDLKELKEEIRLLRDEISKLRDKL